MKRRAERRRTPVITALWATACAIVCFAVPAPTTSAGLAADPAPAGEGQSDQVIIRFRDDAALNAAEARLERSGVAAVDRFDSIDALAIAVDNPQLAALTRSPDVIDVAPPTIYSLAVDPPWGIDRVDQHALPLDHSYLSGAGGAGVTAYVIDTGLWMTHTQFTGRVPRSFVVPDPTVANTGTNDCQGHGTHVAGTLGGSTYGIAPSVSVVPVKVFPCTTSTTLANILAGIDWVITDHQPGQPAVANMSLSGSPDSTLDAAVNALIADGVTVVVAAGNATAPACNSSPARVGDAITVAASDSADGRASFSNFGSCVDLFAPGVGILSAYMGTDTATALMDGTSMASPHVAGAAALYLSGHTGATPAQVAAAIDANTTRGRPTALAAGDPSKLLYVGPATLTATTTGTGTGTVTSPSGLSCAPTCSASVSWGATATLVANASPGSTFTGWSGGGCSGTGTCNAVMNGPASVSAAFTLNTYPIAVSKNGNGTGTIASDAGGINCGATCTTTRNHGTQITLTATPGTGSVFTGWSGAGCSGTGTCTTTVTAAVGVTAGFALTQHALNVAHTGSGAGSVASDIEGIACGTTCTTTFLYGSTVTLSATPAEGSAFAGWSGGSCSGTGTCTTTVTEATVISASFIALPFSAFAEPVRLFDTRPGNVGVLEQAADETSRFAPGEVRRYAPGPAVGVPNGAVLAVNVVAVAPGANGYLQVFPCASTATAPPAASFLNYAAGVTIANNGTVAIDGTGGICVLSSQSANVIVDTTGSLPVGSFTPLAEPVRLLDSRLGQLGALEQQGGSVGGDVAAPLSAGVPSRFLVTGANGIPSSVAALAISIAAVNPAGGGFMTVYPCDSTAVGAPASSTINYRAGGAIANGAVVAPSADGGICVLSSQSTNVIIDTTGYFPVGRFTALDAPVRLVDSRAGQLGALEQPGGSVGSDIGVPLAPGIPVRLGVTGANGIPITVRGLAVNLVAVGPAGGGFITVYPCDSAATPPPASSTINYRAGGAIANGAIVAPSADGGVCVMSSQTSNIIIDTTGYFPA